MWNVGEKFSHRVFFSNYANFKTATGKIKSQLDECHSILKTVYDSLSRVKYLQGGDSKFQKRDICWYQEYKTIDLKTLARFLIEKKFITTIQNFNFDNKAEIKANDLVYSDEDLLIQIAERYIDPDSTYTYAKFNLLFRMPHLRTKAQ